MDTDKLTFITASAGTGKTYRLVEEIREAISSGEARPEAIIATVFNKTAAHELKERITVAFRKDPTLEEAASRLENDALISTVHGVCYRLLRRFAFEAGISPDLRMLDESEEKLLLDRAIDEVVDESARQRLYGVANRLGQRHSKTRAWLWRGDVKDIISTARCNDIDFEQLPEMGRASWAEMRAELGEASPSDMDAEMISRLKAFERAEGDTTKVTNDFEKVITDFLEGHEKASFPWKAWDKLRTQAPGAKSRNAAQPIKDLADQVQRHSGLHRDIESYVTQLFELAHRAGARYGELKKQRGVADFADLEKAALDLLRGNDFVKETLVDEIDLLLVDEFQDTNPMQLALFAELGKIAKKVIWVGDIKQSIYGFRGSDPTLIQKAVAMANKEAPLGTSWRSLPDLVTLANECFAEPFETGQHITKSETVIKAQRDTPNGFPAAVEVAAIISDEKNKDGSAKLLNNKRPSVTADAVADLINRAGEQVGVKGTVSLDETVGDVRPLERDDIAILVRSNKNNRDIAYQLRRRGYEVNLTGGGLLETAEVILAVACLRRWIDATDTLAAAEIAALEGTIEPEVWLEDRLEHVAYQAEHGEEQGFIPWVPQASAAVVALHDARQAAAGAELRSPLECYDKAIAAADCERIVSLWGPNASRVGQRLANLGQLRQYIADYQDRAAQHGIPATLNGLFAWLDDLNQDGKDEYPRVAAKGAITVSTYHSAKGLEWPVVFLTDMDDSEKTRLFNLRVINQEPELDYSNPLRGRELRRWINPFDGINRDRADESKMSPLIKALECSDTGLEAQRAEAEEMVRLMYVGMTRARDRMVLVDEPRSAPVWMNCIGEGAAEQLLKGTGSGKLSVPITRRQYEHSFNPSTREAAASTIDLPVRIAEEPEWELARVAPSKVPAIETARIGEVDTFGTRMRMNRPDERDLGDAMHRILAAEILQGDRVADDAAKLQRIDAQLDAFGLVGEVKGEYVLSTVAAFRKHVLEKFAPQRELVEVPFSIRNEKGQDVGGYIDHLLVLEDGSHVIIDHKIFPGARDKWEAKALTYSGQLRTYAEAVGGERVRTFIHLVTTGVLIEVV